jgi:hypothetical protein
MLTLKLLPGNDLSATTMCSSTWRLIGAGHAVPFDRQVRSTSEPLQECRQLQIELVRYLSKESIAQSSFHAIADLGRRSNLLRRLDEFSWLSWPHPGQCWGRRAIRAESPGKATQ